MAEGGAPLGSARFDFKGDNTDLKAKAAESEKVVKESADRIAATSATGGAGAPVGAGGGAGGEAGGINETLKEKVGLFKQATSGVLGLISVIVRWVGVIGLVYGALTGLISLLGLHNRKQEEAQKATEGHRAAIDGMKSSYTGLTSEVDKYTAALNRNDEAFRKVRDDIAKDDKLTKEDKEALQKQAADAADRTEQDIKNQKKRDEAKKQTDAESEAIKKNTEDAIKARETIASNAKAAARELADDQGVIDLDEQEKRQEILGSLTSFSTAEDKKAANASWEAWKEVFDKRRLAAENIRIADAIAQANATRQAIEDARKIRDAQLAALDQVRSAASSLFAADNTPIVEGLKDISDRLDALAMQRGVQYSGS